MTNLVDVNAISRSLRAEVKKSVEQEERKFLVQGFLASECGTPSRTYASYAVDGAAAVGIDFQLIECPRTELESAILKSNQDPEVDGVMVYYPIFGMEQDNYIKDLVDYRKDVEGLNTFWARKLYANDRMLDGDPARRSILPCTPLAIVKILEVAIPFDKKLAKPLQDKTITIFNRSEVVGRPLAAMLSNDGAKVYSFDVDGSLMFEGRSIQEVSISRKEALQQSDVVIGGVPSKSFEKIKAEEISDNAVCLNFSSIQNFDPTAQEKAAKFIPRVGPVTISILLRNAVRLRQNFFKG